ncbi:MAG: glycosyltransferase family 4 protein [Clostridiaceae bacterium]
MNIVHVCLNGPYTDNWGYQENIVPSYHKKFGHTVTVIAQNQKHGNSGEILEVNCADYYLNDGVRIIRLPIQKKYGNKFSNVFSPYDIYNLLCNLKPDFIMVHGLMGSISALQVGKYIKKENRECVAVADTHQDYYNTHIKNDFKGRVLTFIHRFLNKKMFIYYKKVFYVAPSCKTVAEDYYKVPKDLLELLPLGYDLDLIDFNNKEYIRSETRYLYSINKDDILICHGGKMDYKKKTIELINAVIKLHDNNSKVKLIIFGSFADEYKAKLGNRILENSDFIKHAGMLTPEEYYNVYLASDIAAFPGGQSALWQQAIACGLAAVVKRHAGIEYLDLGGNISFFDSDSVESIYSELSCIIINNQYEDMKKVAEKKGFDYFSYERIAKQVLYSARC